MLSTATSNPFDSSGVLSTEVAPGRVVDVLVIGGGFAGLCMAIHLRQTALSFVILERAPEIGGTWRDNTYPGCSCDIPSHLYSFSFELNAHWSRIYPGQSEILGYLQRCVQKYRLRDSILFSTEAREAIFDETENVWRVRTHRGDTIAARAIVSAMGPLSRPAFPSIQGIERFKGRAFHSSEWDHSFDLTRKKVAVIGTGASAVQFIPLIASKVETLSIFQRTPPWIWPKTDGPIADWRRRMFKSVPGCMRLFRSLVYWHHEAAGLVLVNPVLLPPFKWLARMHLDSKIADPDLRKALTPGYEMGCKRILLSDDYYDALARENVELVTDGIAEIRDQSIVTQDQSERPFDAIIFATGFRASDLLSPLRVIGRNGVDLSDGWRDGAEAFLGMTMAEFPNLFMLVGPNTLLGHNSIVFMIEVQVRYIVKCLEWMRKSGVSTMELRRDVQARFNRDLQSQMRGTAWASGCKSWYLDDRGKNVTLWPASSARYWLRTRRFRSADYSFADRSTTI